MGEDFEVFESYQSGATVIGVRGEIDVATAPAVSAIVTKVLSARPSDVVVDLLDVSFIDSTGLGMLIGAQKLCQQYGTSLGLAVDEPRIQRLFDITGLTGLFTTGTTPTEVIKLLTAQIEVPTVYPTHESREHGVAQNGEYT
jgi:anti-sigma B factor antagonist